MLDELDGCTHFRQENFLTEKEADAGILAERNISFGYYLDMAKIRKEVDAGIFDALKFQVVEYLDTKGENRPMYQLDKNVTPQFKESTFSHNGNTLTFPYSVLH